jgi:DNA-binding NtrC family response regulator
MKNEILLVEDDSSLAQSLERVLALSGYGVTLAPCGEVGRQRVSENRFSAVVADFKLPGLSGLDLVKQIHATNARVPTILMTAHGTADLAIEAMKWGAYDYLLKPFEMPDLLAMIAEAVAHTALSADPLEIANEQPPAALIGKSGVMQAIYKEIGRVAATSATVLIQGESGTGKELVARAIWHYSSRAMQPFVAVNCTSIPETLVESEMFGHERGAFTGADTRRIGRFEQAHKGTIFLDEIGDMTLSTQAKLLRVLQERSVQRVGGREPISVDVRIITATHRDLRIATREKQFREDLFIGSTLSALHSLRCGTGPRIYRSLYAISCAGKASRWGLKNRPSRIRQCSFFKISHGTATCANSKALCVERCSSRRDTQSRSKMCGAS